MTPGVRRKDKEPSISVGLIQRSERIVLRLFDGYALDHGPSLPPGDYSVTAVGPLLHLDGPLSHRAAALTLSQTMDSARFSIEATIGINFHWEQKEFQTFSGSLRLVLDDTRITAINDVPLETYLASVICSEMSADAPTDLAKAHAVISRSWLMAQIEAPPTPTSLPETKHQDHTHEVIKWYDRQSHHLFDVCADDHCQRYQGIGKITNNRIFQDIGATRGQVMTHAGKICDARFSKCCGGVVEDFRTAWGEISVPYLVPLFDKIGAAMPSPALTDEGAFRAFVSASPDAYCNCYDEAIIQRVLPNFDQKTKEFFRWKVRLSPSEAGNLIKTKSGIDCGDIKALIPMERGHSGRLKKLRIEGTKATLVVGKELEIRHLLSQSHLFSSAFVIDTEGPASNPTSFVLHGAGWGHGVGLCQIGAAVMACKGIAYETILEHYYPNTSLERIY